MKKLLLIVTTMVLSSTIFAQGLKDYSAKHGFTMGAGLSYDQIMDVEILEKAETDFNTFTATNEFKAYSLLNLKQSQESKNKMPVMNYTKADNMCLAADVAGLKIRGHVLVWDAYMPDWFFRQNYDPNADFVDRKTMLKRLEYYITDVITHFETNFPGLVYCWDVVNEAVADSQSEAAYNDKCRIRKTRGGKENLFYTVIGQDYVEQSFKFARKVVNKLNPEIKLFYNDYSTFQYSKKQAIIELIKTLNKKEKLCDGMGMQGYIGGYGTQGGCMNKGDISTIKQAILDYAALGIDVQLTEMAVRNYKKEDSYTKQHAEFYKSLFEMFKELNSGDKKPLTSVSIWGLCDNPYLQTKDYSYKMNGPYCGIYDENFNNKSSYNGIVNALK